MKEFFVYALLDPRKPGNYEYSLPNGKCVKFDHEPFYVGKGKGRRPWEHLSGALKNNASSHKLNKIRSIRKSGAEPIIRIGKSRYAKDALSHEKLLIAAVGRYDLGTGPLTNLKDGGEGPQNVSPEIRKHKSRIMKERYSSDSEEAVAYRESVLAGLTRYYARTTGEERGAKAKKIMKARAEFSEERHALYMERKSDSAKKWFSGLSESERSSMKSKQNASKGNYPLQMCDVCGFVGKGGNMKRMHFGNCKTERKLEGPWRREGSENKAYGVPFSIVGKTRDQVPEKWRYLWA